MVRAGAKRSLTSASAVTEDESPVAAERSLVQDAVDNMKQEAVDQHSCRSLPFTLVFWFLFMATQIGHRQVRLQNSMQQALTSTLKAAMLSTTTLDNANATASAGRRLLAAGGRSRADLATAATAQSLDTIKSTFDVLKWLHTTLVPQIWEDGPTGRGTVLDFNRVVGGIRVQQFRLGKQTCPGSPAIQRAYNLSCYNGKPEGPGAAEMAALPGLRGKEDGLHTIWLDLASDMATAQAQVQRMVDADWFSPASQGIWVQCTLLNAQVSLIAYSEVEFFVDRVGRISMYTKVFTLPTEVYGDAWLIWTGDLLMVTMLLWLLLAEVVGICFAFRERSFRRYCKGVRLLNWFVLAFGTGFSIFFGYLSVQLETLAEDLGNVPPGPGQQAAVGAASWTQRHTAMDDIYDEVARLSGLLRGCELATFWYSLLLLLKFFQAFEGNPRLAVITQTLKHSAVDVLHFMIVFMVVFFTFAISAYFLFGHQLKEWANLMVACNSAYRSLMGDFDFGAMYAIAPLSSIAWFWLFMTLTFLVMLNMLLAIILDAYAEVKEGHTDHATIWQQIKQVKIKAPLGLSGKPQPPGKTMEDDKEELMDIFEHRPSNASKAADSMGNGGTILPGATPSLRTAADADPATAPSQGHMSAQAWAERAQQQQQQQQQQHSVDFPGTVPPILRMQSPVLQGENRTSTTPRWFKQ